MLNHFINSLSPNVGTTLSAATLIRTFLQYYSTFPYTTRSIIDPSISHTQNIERATRDAIFIPSIHAPTARKNVAQSCTTLSASLLSYEFSIASQKLEKGDWTACLSSGVDDFLARFGAFIKVEVDIWDISELGGEKIREVVGRLEGMFPRLMVSLGKVAGLEGQVWPTRFRLPQVLVAETGRVNELKGYYLVGVSVGDSTEGLDEQQKRVLEGKVVSTMREFESGIRESREVNERHVWVAAELTSRKKVVGLKLVVDEKDWGSMNSVPTPTLSNQATEEVKNHNAFSTRASATHMQKQKKLPLRPAQDVISRIHWDPKLSIEEFLIGYEDRFVGVKEIELKKWKSEQTDEEFIPMHRIMWVRRKDNGGVVGEKVWDRREKIDLIFRSGVVKI